MRGGRGKEEIEKDLGEAKLGRRSRTLAHWRLRWEGTHVKGKELAKLG
jgi:hypothetical protein